MKNLVLIASFLLATTAFSQQSGTLSWRMDSQEVKSEKANRSSHKKNELVIKAVKANQQIKVYFSELKKAPQSYCLITILQDFPAEFEYVINTFEINHENEYIRMEIVGDGKLNQEKLKADFVEAKQLNK